ncbi:MAG: glycosyl transferase [Moraxellaceae bacterium]|jgi:glycosyltransferase Alg8|nr:glycosyl transferase [Moraxellaceae bacterium]
MMLVERVRPWLPERAGWWLGWLVFGCALGFLATLVPSMIFLEESTKFILLLGLISAWRYSVSLVHFLRAQIFLRVVFPRLRDRANLVKEQDLPAHVYFLVTSFRIETSTSYQVYRAVFMEAMNCGRPASVVASIVERSDEFLIRSVYREIVEARGASIDLIFVRIPGTGKRDGLAHGFRAISRNRRFHESVVVVVDGDTVLMPDCVRDSLPFFSLMPNMGALTTNEHCRVIGSGVIRDWHQLRFAQRHLNMCSMGLTNRVLTLTGRMSIFRGSVVTHPEFINGVQNDYLEHWRLGRFRFLTGDDKSSWFHVMRLGYDTFYVPDVSICTLEHPPDKSFVLASVKLMFRWYGNALRQNMRATSLGLRRLGVFTYYVMLDQRISMWTGLIGVTTALIASFIYGPIMMVAYLLWIGMTRFVVCMILASGGHPVKPSYPVLLYYNQLAGSLVKAWVIFRLDQQSWTRQKTRLPEGSTLRVTFNRWSANAMTFSAFSIFFVLCILLAKS